MFILTKGEWWIACLEFFHIALFAIRLNEYIIYNRLSIIVRYNVRFLRHCVAD